MKKALFSLLIFVSGIVAFCAWFYVASNYDYEWLAGTYKFHGDGVTSTLILRKDHTFHQELVGADQKQVVDGEWHRTGEGGVSFSIQFLRVPGAKHFREEFDHLDGTQADDEFYGTFIKILTVYPTIRLNRDNKGPVFYKSYF